VTGLARVVESCRFKKRQSITLSKRLRLRPVSLREAYGLEALRERVIKYSIANSIAAPAHGYNITRGQVHDRIPFRLDSTGRKLLGWTVTAIIILPVCIGCMCLGL
jgi:hypothetical protein